nr:hypothetical protein [Tanacetum cinerariifolium]
VNDVTRLQALVDNKKVVVTEATIQKALHLDDEEGVECLPNEEIFAELARMATRSHPPNLHFTKHYSQASGSKGFSGIETPLFESMLVEQQVDKEGDADENVEEVNDGDAGKGDVSAAHGEVPTAAEEPSIPSPTPPPEPSLDIPSTSQVQPTPPQSPQRVETSDETVMDDVSNKERMIAEMDHDADVVLEDDKEVPDEAKEVADAVKDVQESSQDQEDETEPAEVQKVVDVVTTAKLITEVVTVANETITATGAIITAAEAQIPTATTAVALTAAPARVAAAPKEPKPLKKKQQIKQDEQYARELQAELNKNIDWDEAIDHVKRKAEEDPAVKRYQVLKRKPQTEAQARKNMMVYLKNVVSFEMDYFKGMSNNDIRPIFEAKFNSNVAFLLNTKEHIEEDENRALKRLNETPADRAAKRKKLDEEVEELKRHLQIVPNEDDDVYTEATPLAQKVPIVDYQIIEMNNKPYYKIIRADDTHQLYVSFLSLLRNFDREDLEALWSLVKERFSTTKPKNFFDDFLLVTLGVMFEKPDIHAQIWKTQRNVHGPAKMMNAVRLKVEEESEVSLEFLRFTRQQHQEGQLE